MNDPKPVANDLASALERARPRFHPCLRCGELTSGGAVCFDCTRKRDRFELARQMTEATIPALFGWARLASDAMRVRVKADLERAAAAIDCARVVFIGPSGTGKTSLAVAMLRAWVARRLEPAAFVLATDLATARARDSLGHEAPEVGRALGAPLLVLDDLGTEADERRSAVTEVIFKRHAEDRPTWITTWKTEDELAQRYGEGVARRVYEGARIIQCGAPR